MPSTLYIIATPIGNLQDATPRMREVIASLDALACEDTRHTGNLLQLLEIPKPPLLFSNHEYNENQSAGRFVALLNQGKKVGLCSDAGYPLISDPGYPAVRAAIEAGHDVVVIPGPSAIPLALIKSGLPCSSYTFKGFAPKKPGARRTFLEQDADSSHTLIFYESPLRVGAFLTEAAEVYGPRLAAVCFELTKQFERCARGSLLELAQQFSQEPPKGEAVIVIAGNKAKFKVKESEEKSPETPFPDFPPRR